MIINPNVKCSSETDNELCTCIHPGDGCRTDASNCWNTMNKQVFGEVKVAKSITDCPNGYFYGNDSSSYLSCFAHTDPSLGFSYSGCPFLHHISTPLSPLSQSVPPVPQSVPSVPPVPQSVPSTQTEITKSLSNLGPYPTIDGVLTDLNRHSILATHNAVRGNVLIDGVYPYSPFCYDTKLESMAKERVKAMFNSCDYNLSSMGEPLPSPGIENSSTSHSVYCNKSPEGLLGADYSGANSTKVITDTSYNPNDFTPYSWSNVILSWAREGCDPTTTKNSHFKVIMSPGNNRVGCAMERRSLDNCGKPGQSMAFYQCLYASVPPSGNVCNPESCPETETWKHGWSEKLPDFSSSYTCSLQKPFDVSYV